LIKINFSVAMPATIFVSEILLIKKYGELIFKIIRCSQRRADRDR